MLRLILKRLMSFQFMDCTLLNSQGLLLTFANLGSGSERFKDLRKIWSPSGWLAKTFLIGYQGFYVPLKPPNIQWESLVGVARFVWLSTCEPQKVLSLGMMSWGWHPRTYATENCPTHTLFPKIFRNSHKGCPRPWPGPWLFLVLLCSSPWVWVSRSNVQIWSFSFAHILINFMESGSITKIN